MTVFKTTDKHAREGSHCDVRALSLYDTYQVPVILAAVPMAAGSEVSFFICSPKMRIEKRKSVAASVSLCLGFVGRFTMQPLSSVRS